MERIKFETARLAQEKGFDKEYGAIMHQSHYYSKTGEKVYCEFWDDVEEFSEYKEKTKYLIPRPYLFELQEWLMEQNIFVEVQLDQTSTPKFAVEIYEYYDVGLFEKIEQKNWFLYRTYQEALEVGLLIGLEQIEI